VASYTERPALDLGAGRAVLDKDVPKALERVGAASLAELGWSRPNPHTLLVPITGTVGDKTEAYLLKLHFRTGRDWPPGAQFVNPETLDYTYPKDVCHLPILEASHAHVHPHYNSNGYSSQLICCSATLEYYDSLHGGEPKFLWQPTDTFLVTLDAIGRAMNSAAYKGRNLNGR
jgi:hypothetical protein